MRGEYMKWNGWFIPHHSRRYPLGDIHWDRKPGLMQLLENSKIIGFELRPALSFYTSQSFCLHLQQPLGKHGKVYVEKEKFMYGSLNIFFKRHEHLVKTQDGPIRLHLQMDYVTGNGPNITEGLSINGFNEEDKTRLKPLLGQFPAMELWFYREPNTAVLSFEHPENKSIWGMLFETTETQGSLILKWSYIEPIPVIGGQPT